MMAEALDNPEGVARIGDVAEWLGKGLQNPVRRFESARHLIKPSGWVRSTRPGGFSGFRRG